MPKEETVLAEYEVLEARDYAGQYRTAGETVSLTARQAKYYLPPLGTGLKLKPAAKVKHAAKGAKSAD